MGVTAVTKKRFYLALMSAFPPKNGHFRRLLTAYIVSMCGRATYKLTWEEIVALYRLTLETAPHNFQPRFNVCPTTKIDAVVEQDGKRTLERMRWGLVPSWWFNVRAETVAEKPMFRSA